MPPFLSSSSPPAFTRGGQVRAASDGVLHPLDGLAGDPPEVGGLLGAEAVQVEPEAVAGVGSLVVAEAVQEDVAAHEKSACDDRMIENVLLFL